MANVVIAGNTLHWNPGKLGVLVISKGFELSQVRALVLCVRVHFDVHRVGVFPVLCIQ